MEKTQSLDSKILNKWDIAANAMGIPFEAYNPSVRIVKDVSGRSKYRFGIIYNPFRSKYVSSKISSKNCYLCEAIEATVNNPKIKISPTEDVPGFIIIPNKFPIVRGTSLAIEKQVHNQEVPMYNTCDLQGLSNQLKILSRFSVETGFDIFHNSEGAGASVPRHEHWHLTNYDALYSLNSGEKHGIDELSTAPLKGSTDVYTFPEFPFAHLIFKDNDFDKVSTFLTNLGTKLGPKYPKGFVPHGLIYSPNKGTLVIPSKKSILRGPGAGDMAGHVLCKSEEEFNQLDFNSCLHKLNQVLFCKSEISLEKFI